MNYFGFAKLYDDLMSDAPYDQWIAYMKRCLQQDDLDAFRVLDVGCGTGEILIRMIEDGAEAVGVDLSNEMLTIAREKCDKHGMTPMLVQQSMDELDGLGMFQVVTIFCDSINYLQSEQQVQETFQRVAEHLLPNGILLFDVHSEYKIEHGFIDQTFAEDAGDIAYIWTSFRGETDGSVEHELTFFVQDEETGHYERIDELHKQRTYSIEKYEQMLVRAGLDVISVTADFSNENPTAKSERIFFCARKK